MTPNSLYLSANLTTISFFDNLQNTINLNWFLSNKLKLFLFESAFKLCL